MRHKIIATVAATLAALVAGGAGTIAAFAADSSGIREGRPLISVAIAGLPPVADAAPRGATAATVTITNAGTATGELTVARTTMAAAPIRVRIADGAGRVLYVGALDGLDTVQLGLLPPGQAREVHVRLSLPSAGGRDDALQKQVAWRSLMWSLTQA